MDGQKQKTQQEQKKLGEITVEELGKLETAELGRLCTDEGLGAAGEKAELLKRLTAKKAEQQGPKKLSEITIEELAPMKIMELRRLCTGEGIAAGGRKAELLRRLEVKKTGTSVRYAGQLTRCKVCGKKVRVISTDSQTMEDGRTLITRTVRCSGRHAHTYPLKDVV